MTKRTNSAIFESRGGLTAYGAAIAFAALAVALRLGLDPVLGDRLPLATLYGAVALSVWYGGYGPALVATFLGYAACDYFFIPPRGSITPMQPATLAGQFAYLLSCGIIIWFGVLMRTNRHRAEQSAHEASQQREQLRVTLASIGDGVVAADRDERITLINPVAEALTGWSANEAAGRMLGDVFNIVNEHTRQPVESPATKAIDSGRIVGLANHTVLIARDGTERAIEDSAAPIRDESGDITGVILSSAMPASAAASRWRGTSSLRSWSPPRTRSSAKT